jgi:GH24 family phage-related lysozyme (muramidase)
MTQNEFYTLASDFIKKFEGFSAVAKWDVNAWRLGYGSSTITFDNGTYRKVLQTDTTTKENASKDLQRRIKLEFEPKVRAKVGAQYYDKLSPYVKIALISFAYNYGNIVKKAIVEAVKTLDKDKIADAIISSTINDNIGTVYYQGLRNRRKKEADYARTPYENTIQGANFYIFPILIIGLLFYFFNK